MTTTQRSGAGFSLVEVLVSVAVLSIGLLGAIGMLLAAVRAGKEAATFNAAVGLVRDLSEKVRMNPGVAAGNGAANTYLVERAGDGATRTPQPSDVRHPVPPATQRAWPRGTSKNGQAVLPRRCPAPGCACASMTSPGTRGPANTLGRAARADAT